jgi:hypothetical protein
MDTETCVFGVTELVSMATPMALRGTIANSQYPGLQGELDDSCVDLVLGCAGVEAAKATGIDDATTNPSNTPEICKALGVRGCISLLSGD